MGSVHPHSQAAGYEWNRLLLPKLCGADIELANFILGMERRDGTGFEASRALLAEIAGLPWKRFCPLPAFSTSGGGSALRIHPSGYLAGGHSIPGGSLQYDPQDWGRRFLTTNGGCAYIDLDHLELCIPEVLSAFDHVASWHAMLRIAHQAYIAANEKLPEGRRLQVLVNNSDGMGHSYGSHLNFLITRRAWENLFNRKLQNLLFLAAYQVSSIVFTGQGKVGSENYRDGVPYQISQRADFFERLTGFETTINRPIVNSRDEAHCGRFSFGRGPGQDDRAGMARLHVIFYDNSLAHVTCLLKVGVLQIILAMIEAEVINLDLTLDDPLAALIRWSHDPSLGTTARMVSGREVTAVELQMLFLEEAKKFLDTGLCEGIVPRASEILDLWEDTLLKLRAGEFETLAPRLDWVMKLLLLRRAMERRSDLSCDSPEAKHLDHLFSSIDRVDGLYWICERDGLAEKVVSDETIERFTLEPPVDSRAWTRAMLLRLAGSEAVMDVDWDFIRFRTNGISGWPTSRIFDMEDPLDLTEATTGPILNSGAPLDEVLDELESLTNSRSRNHGCP